MDDKKVKKMAARIGSAINRAAIDKYLKMIKVDARSLAKKTVSSEPRKSGADIVMAGLNGLKNDLWLIKRLNDRAADIGIGYLRRGEIRKEKREVKGLIKESKKKSEE